MLKAIYRLFRLTKTRTWPMLVGEALQGMLLAAPGGLLLLVIWELVRPEPSAWKITATIIGMALLFALQLWLAGSAMLKTYLGVYGLCGRLRLAVGDHLQKLSLGFYNKRDAGDIAGVILQDISGFESIFPAAWQSLCSSLFGTLFLAVFLLALDAGKALFMLAAIPLTLGLILLAARLASAASGKQAAARNASSARFLEYVLGIRQLKSYNLTGRRFHCLHEALGDLRRHSIRVEALIGSFVITSFVFFELFFVLMAGFFVADFFVQPLSFSLPVFIAFLILGYRLYEPLKALVADYATLHYMNASISRISTVLDSPLQTGSSKIEPASFDICFTDVRFAYTKREVLKNISLRMEQGQMTALVGASGAGKTTIAHLIARFWEVQAGQITIGGHDLREMAPETIYSLISVVFQQVYLFNGSIRENITIGKPDASEEEIMIAARKAQLAELLAELPEGLGTMVGEGGGRLSGGQKQRISIARALLKDAPIILLDEATSSLDPENELSIQLAVEELVRNKTVIVIAHKLQTIRNADRIIVLDDGQVAEQGRHEELLSKEGLYARYWWLQQRSGGWEIRRGVV